MDLMMQICFVLRQILVIKRLHHGQEVQPLTSTVDSDVTMWAVLLTNAAF